MLSHSVFTYDEKIVSEFVIDGFSATLQEYTNQVITKDQSNGADLLKFSVGVVPLKTELVEDFVGANTYNEKSESLKMLLGSISFEKLFLDEVKIVIDSGSFYVDSLVGFKPATENYSEIMRDLEARKISSGIARQDVENDLLRAKDRILRRGENFISSVTNFTKQAENASAPAISYSLLKLNSAAGENQWEVYVDTREVPGTRVTTGDDGKSIVIAWPGDNPISNAPEKELMLLGGSNVLVTI